MNLLARRTQLGLASQGCGLLKNKRESLLKELMAVVPKLANAHSDLQESQGRSMRSFAFADGLDGRNYLRSVATASRSAVSVRLDEDKVWGVRIPTLTFAPLKHAVSERNVSPSGVSTRTLEAAGDAEEMLEYLLAMVPLHVRLERLGREVKKTSRRVNALEQVLIPALEADIRNIGQALEEMEREDMFRLRRIKKKKERQKKTREHTP